MAKELLEVTTWLFVSFGRTPSEGPERLAVIADEHVRSLGLTVIARDPGTGVVVGPEDVGVAYLVEPGDG